MIPAEIPFYFKSHSSLGNGGFPVSLPFELFYDDSLKMYRQIASPELKNILHEVYKLGSLVDGSISNESGYVYVDKTVGYIRKQVGEIRQKNILEIGCGNGIILKHLQTAGAILTGLEPGEHGVIEGFEPKKIIRDFFPSPKLEDKFDLIIHFFVLEHIEDPVKFLAQHKKYLTANGKVILGVPNCEPFLKDGDISMFIHEHYNYFTTESIKRLSKQAGFSVQDISVLDGMLIATLDPHGMVQPISETIEIEKEQFENKIERFNTNLQKLFTKYTENDIAVYVPGRALNSMFLARKNKCRLVDDNSELYGKYLPYFLNPVESFEQLADMPPKCILIYSRTFGDKIKTKCMNHPKLRLTNIINISALD